MQALLSGGSGPDTPSGASIASERQCWAGRPDPARGVPRRALEEAATRPEASGGPQASFFRLSQVGGVGCNRRYTRDQACPAAVSSTQECVYMGCSALA